MHTVLQYKSILIIFILYSTLMLLFNIRFHLYPFFHPLEVQAERLLLLHYGLIMDFVFQTLVGDHVSLSLLIQVFSSSSSGTTIGNKKSPTMIEGQTTQAREELLEDQEETSLSEVDSKSLASGVFFFPDPSLNDDHPCDLTSPDGLYKDSLQKQEDDDDDDTASTFDMMDCDDEYPISPCSSFRKVHSPSPLLRRNVHFPEQLVTHIYTRPFTTPEDKYYLHYDEHDFMDFKLQYRADMMEASGQSSRRRRSSLGSSEPPLYYRKSGSQRVSFQRDVVTSIHPVMDLSARKKIHHELFYTEQEMRQFLDDFVLSLQQLGGSSGGPPQAQGQEC